MVSAKSSPSGPHIPRFYAGRSVFITGGTGFVGKVLIERLLSTCPDIGRLYLLMRSKKDISPEKRLMQLKQSEVFDVIRQRDPSQLDKMAIIPGDVAEPQLGVSLESLAMLHDVSIVFHSAATLKFDEELRKAVDQNVRSVMRLMDICDRLPKLEAFIHVSTAYSNSDRDTVEERVYPPPVPLDQVLALVDSAPPELLTEITAKYISPKPNTYTFTKAIAENVVVEHGHRGYSMAIFRPSIVISSLKHPFPGWIENLNGPSGFIVGAGKGLLHVFSCKMEAKADMLPVDIAVDTLIAVAWETAIDRSSEVRVYNCCSIENPVTWRQFEQSLRTHLCSEVPLDKAMWYPSGFPVQNNISEKVLEFLLQTLPLHMTEYVMRICRVKSNINFITASQKLKAVTRVLKFFTLREWVFETSNVRRLRARISKRDAEIYNLDPRSINWEEEFYNFVVGTRRYLLKEKDQDLEEARRHMHRMSVLHHGVLYVSLLLFIRYLLGKKVIKDFVFRLVRTLISVTFTTIEKVRT